MPCEGNGRNVPVPGGQDPRSGGRSTEAATRRRAAKYVRMSTEHQKYSTENQADAIRDYAAKHDMEIVRTYADAGKSGLRLEGREALQQLLEDVKSGAERNSQERCNLAWCQTRLHDAALLRLAQRFLFSRSGSPCQRHRDLTPKREHADQGARAQSLHQDQTARPRPAEYLRDQSQSEGDNAEAMTFRCQNI